MLIPTDRDQQQLHRARCIQQLIAQQQQQLRCLQQRGDSISDTVIRTTAEAYRRKGLI